MALSENELSPSNGQPILQEAKVPIYGTALYGTNIYAPTLAQMTSGPALGRVPQDSLPSHRNSHDR